ncbi:MAG: hypothetical protein J0H74_01045 [Chitinophagaceae bacterium]|nr:hypothetical protein [Chitinophagaceae bacterium]
MKKILILSMAAFLFAGIAHAEKDKGKKKEKQKTHKTCPGKECGKKS